MAKHWLAAPPIDAGLADVELPIALTEDDRRWLEGVLPHLPSLHYPISDGVRAAFLSAYRNLKERRAWEPCLLTEKDVSRHKLKQDAVFVDHRNALERMFETGTLSLFNRRHAPASGFSVRGLISRTAAIAYLEQHGFVCRDPESEKTPDQPGQSDAEWRPGQRKISLEREQEVFIYYMGQKAANVRGPRKATAEHYGVTRKTIYNICERVEERRKNGRLD
ncbi:hypothetical protein GQ56_0119870 [Burkholderia paludis]|nr:hypothetical protein GQ56_0119870 [Burkholderia paludis]